MTNSIKRAVLTGFMLGTVLTGATGDSVRVQVPLSNEIRTKEDVNNLPVSFKVDYLFDQLIGTNWGQFLNVKKEDINKILSTPNTIVEYHPGVIISDHGEEYQGDIVYIRIGGDYYNTVGITLKKIT